MTSNAFTLSQESAAIVLDFGVEIQGYVELITPMTPDKLKPRRVRVRLGEPETAELCEKTVARLRKHTPEINGRKSPAALAVLAGLRDAKEVEDRTLKKGGPEDVSTFYGFYVLEALAKSGDIDTALDFISTYWGGMLDLGATTFWENFDLEWTENAGRIDELVPADKEDIHGDFGAHCYVGYRHSFCHGWASGPTAWLSQHVLG